MSDTSTETEANDAVDATLEAEAAPAEAPEAEAVVEEAIVEEGATPEEHEVEAAGSSGPRARAGLATLYLCERGHRTLAVWSDAPTTCHARPTRAGSECGRPVYHSTELPETVQKALNPIKASKKTSKG